MRTFFILTLGFALSICAGCGASGPPIAPEDVGLEAKIRAQQKQSTNSSTGSDTTLVPLEEEAAHLPALHPIGTR